MDDSLEKESPTTNEQSNSKIKTLITAARPPFLLLPIVCVILGIASVRAPLEPVNTLLVFLAALIANACVNLFNEYFDFQSGLDLTTEKTPFSGGSGALVVAPEYAKSVLHAALVAVLALLTIGGYFLWLRGWHIVPLGVCGIVLIIAYTNYINAKPWLCLIAPGFGIGSLMVVGTFLALSPSVTVVNLLNAIALSMLPFFLINNLLLLNQIPDIEPDRKVGRNHFAIAYGITSAKTAFAVFWLLAATTIVALVEYQLIPMAGLWALIPLFLSGIAWFGLKKHQAAIGTKPHFLALNVIATLTTPLFIAVVILFDL